MAETQVINENISNPTTEKEQEPPQPTPLKVCSVGGPSRKILTYNGKIVSR